MNIALPPLHGLPTRKELLKQFSPTLCSGLIKQRGFCPNPPGIPLTPAWQGKVLNPREGPATLCAYVVFGSSKLHPPLGTLIDTYLLDFSGLRPEWRQRGDGGCRWGQEKGCPRLFLRILSHHPLG